MGLFDRLKKKKTEQQTEDFSDLRSCFERNIRYINSNVKDADTIRRQFVKTGTRWFLTVGHIDCPTGRIMIGDPLAYMPKHLSPVLEKTVEPGVYPIEVSLCRSELIGIRVCTVRMKIKNTPAVTYGLAEPTEESAAFIASDGVLCAVPVDAGMVSICDEKVAWEYQAFLEENHKKDENWNHYNDYFAEFFRKSAEKLPAYQNEDGDFIEWEVPDTHNRMVMVASGFGDGLYQFYYGYDDIGEICELIIPLINPDLLGL